MHHGSEERKNLYIFLQRKKKIPSGIARKRKGKKEIPITFFLPKA